MDITRDSQKDASIKFKVINPYQIVFCVTKALFMPVEPTERRELLSPLHR